MAVPTLDIGVMFSTTGSYRAVGKALAAGALLAVEEVDADAGLPIRLAPHQVDPGGVTDNYRGLTAELLSSAGLNHVVGCYTSSSRKEVLPLFEKRDALLWYPSHYEGFETSDNVVYTGAAPNQHIVPLTDYVARRHGTRAWFVGSNYIWAWENNRIMRESLLSRGGRVLGERYLPVGDTDLEDIIGQILKSRPDFVFVTLIGESAYAFFRRFRAEAGRCGVDQANEIPVVSCSLSEPELVEIGPEASAGHLSSSVYFESLDTVRNRRFVDSFRRRFPGVGPASADAEAAYIAVHLLARAVVAAGSADIDAVRAAVSEVSFAAPQGPVRIDAENRHCYLRPRIGRSTAEGGFEVVFEAPAPVRPDPYLIWHSATEAQRPDPGLRIVS